MYRRITVHRPRNKNGQPVLLDGTISTDGTLYLQRRGTSSTIRATAGVTPEESFYLEVNPQKAKFEQYRNNKLWFARDLEVKDSQLETAQQLLDLVEATHNGKKITVGNFIEGYCHGSNIDDDRFISPVEYCEYSDTVRHYPSNICLVAFENGEFAKKDLLVDRAAAKWRDQIDQALAVGFHECDLRHGDQYCKERLAWLIGRYILDVGGEEIHCVITDQHLRKLKF